MKKEIKPIHGLIPLSVLAVIIFTVVVKMNGSLQIPLIIGTVTAGLVAAWLGWSWDEILKAMLEGIDQSLEALLILMSIGILTASWVAGGTVPTIISYGMAVIRPRFFLVSAFVLCTIISIFIGAWGTASTIGLAFMSMGQVMGVPAPAIAGAVVAGSYIGDKLSPFSDGTNLAAAVAQTNVFQMIRRVMPTALPVWGISALLYLILGLRWNISPEGPMSSLPEQLGAAFHIGLLPLLPIAVIILCVLLKLPSLLAILLSAFTGGLLALTVQGASIASLLSWMTEGYVSHTGIEAVDQLLSVGGILSMMNIISVILISMSFGGVMKGTGLMDALIRPVVSRIRTSGGLVCLTVFTCFGVNLLFPDQYMGMTIPGQMYSSEYSRREIDPTTLGNALGAGAAVTSPLVPWNNCGVYMTSVLGISPLFYAPYAFFNWLLPIAFILWGFLTGRKNVLTKRS